MEHELNVYETSNLPNAIFITKTLENAGSAKFDKRVQQVNAKHNIKVICIDEIKTLADNGTLFLPDGVRVNQMLVRDPYLEHASTFIIGDENAESRIRKDKFLKILEIAELLGAESCEIVSGSVREYKRKANPDMTVGTIWFSSKVKLNKDADFSEEIGVKINQRWKGIQIITQAQFDKAEQLAKKSELYNDGEIQRLLSSRNPNNPNTTSVLDYTFNITREANDNLDAAFALCATEYFNLDASYKRSIKEKKTMTITMKFNFPNQ